MENFLSIFSVLQGGFAPVRGWGCVEGVGKSVGALFEQRTQQHRKVW